MQLFDVYPLYPIQPVSGRGAIIIDDKGQEYLDFYGGHAVISIGHAHPHYVDRISQQLQKLGFYSNSIQNPLQVELAEKLGKLSGCDSYSLFLCNSGAEANENALKLASFHSGKSRIIAFEGGFHGRTSAAVSVTDNNKIKAPINTHSSVTFLPLDDIEAVSLELGKGDVAAVIIEGIQGISGIYEPTTTFLQLLDKTCKENEVVLILDEIQSGYGRSGDFFAFQSSGIQPDLITMAKGMGNGFPIGGVLISDRFEAKHGMLGTTFGGNHLACSAGLAVLEVMEAEKLMDNATILGQELVTRLADLDKVKQVRGRGLMIGMSFDFPIKDLRKSLIFDHHLFTGSAKDPYTLRLLPPLNITSGEVERALTAIRQGLQNI